MLSTIFSDTYADARRKKLVKYFVYEVSVTDPHIRCSCFAPFGRRRLLCFVFLPERMQSIGTFCRVRCCCLSLLVPRAVGAASAPAPAVVVVRVVMDRRITGHALCVHCTPSRSCAPTHDKAVFPPRCVV